MLYEINGFCSNTKIYIFQQILFTANTNYKFQKLTTQWWNIFLFRFLYFERYKQNFACKICTVCLINATVVEISISNLCKTLQLSYIVLYKKTLINGEFSQLSNNKLFESFVVYLKLFKNSGYYTQC